MRLGSISVFFPVLHLQAKASYRLLPELTPLHRALEAAVQEFHRGGNALASVPIAELFRLLYGVSGAREILPEVLEDLIERGRVHQIGRVGIDPSSLRIIDLAPGRGAEDKALSSASSAIDHHAAQTREIARFFDPVLEEIVDAAELVPGGNEARDFCVPAEPFLAHLPSHWVERELRSELRDDVQLYSAAPRLLDHGWRRVTAELVINDGELSVECGDPRQTDYLRGLSQRVRGSWLLPSSPNTTFDWSSLGGESLSVERAFLESVAGEIDATMGGRGAITALTKWLIDPVSHVLFTEVADRSACIGKVLVIAQDPDGSVRVSLEAE